MAVLRRPCFDGWSGRPPAVAEVVKCVLLAPFWAVNWRGSKAQETDVWFDGRKSDPQWNSTFLRLRESLQGLEGI